MPGTSGRVRQNLVETLQEEKANRNYVSATGTMEKDCTALWNKAKALRQTVEKRWTLLELKGGASGKQMRKDNWAWGTAGPEGPGLVSGSR